MSDLRTDFDQIEEGARVVLHPRSTNPLHKLAVTATFSDGYFYCEGSPVIEGPDYYLGDVLKFNEGYSLEGDAA